MILSHTSVGHLLTQTNWLLLSPTRDEQQTICCPIACSMMQLLLSLSHASTLYSVVSTPWQDQPQTAILMTFTAVFRLVVHRWPLPNGACTLDRRPLAHALALYQRIVWLYQQWWDRLWSLPQFWTPFELLNDLVKRHCSKRNDCFEH